MCSLHDKNYFKLFLQHLHVLIISSTDCFHRGIFVEDHIPEIPDRSLPIDRKTSKRSLCDVVFHENDSKMDFEEGNTTI